MDLQRTIRELRDERNRVLRRITAMERVRDGEDTPRRGRKSMGKEERQQVSERMCRYWANRRKDS
jgi:hypothetical protein